MAAIGVDVNKEGLWSVTLDRFEWTALTADGNPVSKVNDTWHYQQKTAGDFKFKATAVGTQFLNAQQNWSIQCGDLYYYLVLDYDVTDDGFILTGRGYAMHTPINVVSNPHGFSQGKMMGSFGVDCAS